MNVVDLFSDHEMIAKIQARLPDLFHIAEMENSRAGKIGMEVGSARERILIALLIFRFGESNVVTDIPITESEIDVIVSGRAISIKTFSGKKMMGIKLCWTVDAEKAVDFCHFYSPRCDILLAQVNWNNEGGLYFLPQTAQVDTLNQMGRHAYFKLPKSGTNPRGVEISANALQILTDHPQSRKIPINWQRKAIEYHPYQRWIDLWKRA